MSNTPVRKRRRRRRKQQPWVPLAAGFGLVAALVLAIVGLESALAPEETEPTYTEPPTVQTLPTNPYSAEDFTYDENGYLTCRSSETRLGIDVSDHQKEIDWARVAEAGIEFAIVRIGYRGYSEGGIYPDEAAPENIKGAQAQGLDAGVYF